MTANVNKWSKTAATNSGADPDINWAEGQAPSTVNNSARSLMQGIANQRDDQGGQLTLAGGTTVYTLATNSTNSAYADGMEVCAVVNVANTGASTLNVDTIGAKNIYKSDTTGIVALVANDMTVDMHAKFQYDASLNAAAGGWVLLNPASTIVSGVYLPLAGGTLTGNLSVSKATPTLVLNAAASGQERNIFGQTAGVSRWKMTIGNATAEGGANAGSDLVISALDDSGAPLSFPLAITRSTGQASFSARPTFNSNTAYDTGNLPAVLFGYLSGLALSRASATTFGIAVGTARNEDGGTAYNMTLASAFTKSLSAWAVGTGNGGLDTGAVGASTWYHVHLIRKDSDGSIDVLYSLSATGPTMPGGYTARRRIGSFLTNGSSQIVNFIQNGDKFVWDVGVLDINVTNPGTAAVTRTLSVPTGVKVDAIVAASVLTAANFFYGLLTDLAQTDTTPSSSAYNIAAFDNAGTPLDTSEMRVTTNTSGQIRSRISASGAGDTLRIFTLGWLDTRGK